MTKDTLIKIIKEEIKDLVRTIPTRGPRDERDVFEKEEDPERKAAEGDILSSELGGESYHENINKIEDFYRKSIYPELRKLIDVLENLEEEVQWAVKEAGPSREFLIKNPKTKMLMVLLSRLDSFINDWDFEEPKERGSYATEMKSRDDFDYPYKKH